MSMTRHTTSTSYEYLTPQNTSPVVVVVVVAVPAPRYLILPYSDRCRTKCWSLRRAARLLKQSQTTITVPLPSYDLYRPFIATHLSFHGLRVYPTIAFYGKKLPPEYHNPQVGNIIGHRGQGSPTHICNPPPGPCSYGSLASSPSQDLQSRHV